MSVRKCCLSYCIGVQAVSQEDVVLQTDDVDGVSDVAEDDCSLASHLTRVVSTVTILDVCKHQAVTTVLRHHHHHQQ